MKAKQWVELNIFQLAFPGAKLSLRFMCYILANCLFHSNFKRAIQHAVAEFLVVKVFQHRPVSGVCKPFTLQKQQLSYQCGKITHELGNGPA